MLPYKVITLQDIICLQIRRELIKELNSPEYTMDLDQDLPTLLKNRKSKSKSLFL